MKKVAYLAIFQILFGLSFLSCEKGSDDNGDDDRSGESMSTIRVSDVRLYNQYSQDVRFYDVLRDTAFSDTVNVFDFAFLQTKQELVPTFGRFALATSSSFEGQEILGEASDSIAPSSSLLYYNLPTSFKGVSFDTLTSVEALKSVMKNSTIYYNARTKSDCLYSDRFGWSSGSMFGFRIDGKWGIVKILSMSPYVNKGEGYVDLKIKFEGE